MECESVEESSLQIVLLQYSIFNVINVLFAIESSCVLICVLERRQ